MLLIKVRVLDASCQDNEQPENKNLKAAKERFCGLEYTVKEYELKEVKEKYEVGEVVKVSFNHYRSQYYFLSTVIEINETPEIALRPKSKRKTRPESLISISQPEQKNSRTLTNPYSSQANVLGSQHRVSSTQLLVEPSLQEDLSTQVNSQLVLSNPEQVPGVQKEVFRKIMSKNKQKHIEPIESVTFTVDQMIEMSTKNQFPKRTFVFGKNSKKKTPTTHFYNVETNFQGPVSDEFNLIFTCKLCQTVRLAPLKDLGNLMKHLKTHDQLVPWILRFLSTISKNTKVVLSGNDLKLVKYFISANASLTQLSNPCFKDILDSSITAPTYHTFRNVMLPEVMVKLFNHIESKLKHAAIISLVVDIWTNRVNADFIALGAVLVDFNFNRQLIVIDMQRMKGGHCAENIQIAIEDIINKYSFDYRKIVGIVCDEGSSLVRLFGQLLDQSIIFGDEDVVEETNFDLVTFSNIMDKIKNKYSDSNANQSTTVTSSTEPDVIETNLEGVSALPDATSITNEINDIVTHLETLKFNNNIQLSASPTEKVLKQIQYNDEYDLTSGIPITELNLKIGSSNIPRFQCACHKLNLAIKHAIENHTELSNLLKDISVSNANFRRSIRINHTFREKKCRLRLQNLTRWSSAYLMMESVKRAYDR